MLSEDAYYRDQTHLSFAERERRNYDHPDAIEQNLLARHLGELREGRAVDAPVYDYGQHTRADQTRRIEPASVLIIEGILVLANPAVRDLTDLKLYIDAPLDVCLLRRLRRDVEERDRSVDSVAQQYLDTVRPGYHRFVRPSAEYADLVITRGGRNRVALDTVRRAVLDRVSESASPQASVGEGA